jgi:acyl-CoA reductase-like NAD-dependent aldehyde dehydrogenase
MFAPTILVDTSPDMDVNRTEMFAPVITFTRYRDFTEAVHLVDNSQYGLQAGIFTQDINRIMQSFNNIEVAALLVNDIPTYRMDQMPYGGVKNSGFGREGPKYAIEEMTEMRMLIINRDGGRI